VKVAILAGGVGTRLVEETQEKPKPMVQIGNQPILWHILKHYAHYGHKDFYIALGYKGEVIKRYMVDYCSLSNDLTVDFSSGQVHNHKNDHARQDWTVHLIGTGDSTLTGGRIKRLAPFIGNETFMLTWGDGVSNINLNSLLEFHRSHGKLERLAEEAHKGIVKDKGLHAQETALFGQLKAALEAQARRMERIDLEFGAAWQIKSERQLHHGDRYAGVAGHANVDEND